MYFIESDYGKAEMTRASTPLIIEVRANEVMSRQNAPRVPLTVNELVADALECAAAGASIYHWHGRDAISGEAVDDIDDFVAVCREVRAQSDILLKPTAGFGRESARARMSHVIGIVDAGSEFIDIVPVDNFTANCDVWDAVNRRFETDEAIIFNTRRHVEEVLAVARELGLKVSIGCPDIGAVRTGRCFIEMGALKKPVHWELVFSGDMMPLAASPTVAALEAMVEAVPIGDTWSAYCTGGDILPLIGTVILMGGHVAIGLGDCPQSRFGSPSNSDLVCKVRQIAEIAGRPVATPREAREILGIL